MIAETKNIDVLLLNLPNDEQITRRYMCSYVSPESLLPPVELLSVAAVARAWKNSKVTLLDCIADKITRENLFKKIKKTKPNIIVSLVGFECFEEDLLEIKAIKKDFPEVKFIVFGHYATHFPEVVLKESGADFVLMGEPEETFSQLYDALVKEESVDEIKGLAYFQNQTFVKQGGEKRIAAINELPMPAYDLLSPLKYYEPLLAKPFGMIQTARGCPYQCEFCVKSYGTKLTTLTPERIVDEMKAWIEHFNVKSIRFIDDTFTINKKRVIALCKLIIQEKINIDWACLSRTDNIDEEILTWMKKAGCKRIYFGMESGSQRMLDIYQKNIKVEEAKAALHLCKEYNIETAAFFMSGHPDETEEDFLKTIDFARTSKLSFASFNPLTPYPGTATFDIMKDKIEFSIFPYKNEWQDKSIYDDFDRRKKIFYKSFYMRPNYFIGNGLTLLKNTKEIFNMGIGMLRYLWFDSKFVISGLKGYKDR